MSLPVSLLQYIEKHPCFPGVWHSEADVQVCLDPNKPVMKARVLSCSECYTKLSALESLLPPSFSASTLARDLTHHMRALRGFAYSAGGYHTRGPGFWVSVGYFRNSGVFLIDGARSRQLGSDLDLLLLAFQHGVLQSFAPLLHDATQYRTQPVHVNFATQPGPIRSKQDLLAWSGCRLQPAPGYHAVTLAEFLPLVNQATPTTSPRQAPTAAPAPVAAAPSGGTRKVGDICTKCRSEYRLRPLLNGTYLGCLC